MKLFPTPEVKEFIEGMLDFTPKTRFSVEEALNC